MTLISPPTGIDSSTQSSAWLFVRVIDNFGDAGVAWRLATALAQELKLAVYLWVDEPAVLAQLVPFEEQQRWSPAIHVLPWHADEQVRQQLRNLVNPHWVIETFGCDLPAPVLTRIAQCRPLWLNWEYLSAEDWAVDLHAMPSLQLNAVAKYFWFMGIDANSGGLLREADYVQRQQRFQADPASQLAFRHQYGLPLRHQGALWLVFAYDAADWSAWLAMWQQSGQPMTVWLAGGQVVRRLQQQGVLPATALLQDGAQYQYGSVTLVRIPFVPQSVFDQLLWLADGAIVRGEDSLVRALWAGIPFFWHIYPQTEQTHWHKLHAFWHKITAQWSGTWLHEFARLSDDLNAVAELNPEQRLAAWQTLMQHRACWQQAASATSSALQQAPTAMEKLARFEHDTLK